MERSGDRYLHKKFKKQLSIEPNTHNADKEEKIAVPGMRISEPLQNYHNSDSFADNTVIAGLFSKTSDDTPVKDNIYSVPKLSTNNENTFNVTVLESSNLAKSSISHLNVGNAIEKGESNANVSERSKQAGELVDLQSSNSCISYVISKSSRVENQSQPESHFRAVNFDTRFNVSEPIAIPTADTSSILDNVYSKQYVTSKLVNVEKVGDISSNVSIGNNDHASHQEDFIDNRNAESKHENHTPELGTAEKSSGGKYICSYCNLACSKPSVLQKHIRAHTNERPYPCVSCGFSFKTRSNLYKHCRSRTHANRVMGNKAQEIHNEADTDSQTKMEYIDQSNSVESGGEDTATVRTRESSADEKSQSFERLGQEIKTKPYKPRFHTAKAFFDNTSRDNQKDVEDQKVPETVQNRPSNSDLLSLHINEVINKNNAIVNSNESYLLRKRSVDNSHIDNVNNNEPQHRHSEVTYSQNPHVILEERQNEEPLNLTNKPRKRCLSEVAEPAMHTSLIKELLLKNLYADSMQCPHCKMIFQTVTELELHKMRSCKAFIKSGARYSRSSSVNVASILTKNKNAFDNIPQLQNTTFPLKSPGPFLGKTRLVESDKCKSFSFDDGLPTFQNSLHNSSDILRTTLRYSLSPLTIQQDKVKKTPVKLFGGEVKITQTSGETKSFKIDSKESEKYGGDHFSDFGGRLSENRVVKSSLQSGGTVLQNKPNYNSKQDSLRSSPDVIRVYESTTLSPSIDIASLEKTKFNFERQQNPDFESEYKSNSEFLVRPPADAIGSSNFNNTASASYKYTNIMDFSQKAVKLLAPNLKQPNLTIPGVPMPTMSAKIVLPRSPSLALEIKHDPPRIFEPLSVSRSHMENERVNVINLPTTPKNQEPELRHLENIQFAQKQILLHQKMAAEPLSPRIQSPNLCNPVNLLVNGKVVRYVPGIPGPIAADVPSNVAYGSTASRSISSNFRSQKSNMRINVAETSKSPLAMETNAFVHSPIDRISETRIPLHGNQLQMDKKCSEHEPASKSPKFGTLEIKTSESVPSRATTEMKSPSVKSIEIKSPSTKNDMKSPNHSAAPNSSGSETPKKFARPNTLALKPSIAAHKQHHGLTPTMFNQILISPDTPRVAKKYMQHFLHGNYFSYLGLKSSTKSVYCTLNKTQPFYVPHFKKLSMYSEWRQQDTKADKLYVSAYDSRQKQQKYVTAGKATVDLVVHSSYKFIVTETSSCRGEEHLKANSILGGYESNEDYTYVRGRGRGRYVCDQCGIRCKKPSMLKKHIRTHTNDRPFTCNHCNFSFKTKGNLTKHMKSKAHTKNYAASSSSSSSAQQSGTQSSESDTDDSGMDSSDESTRQQEHEAAYGLLSLSQKTTQNATSNSQTDNYSMSPNPVCSLGINLMENPVSFMNTEQVTQVNNTNFAKNKILDQQVTINFNASKILNDIPSSTDSASKEMQNLIQFLGKTNTSRPLTYPYTSSDVVEDQDKSDNEADIIDPVNIVGSTSSYESCQSPENKIEQRNVSALNIVQKHNIHHSPSETFSSKVAENRRITIPITISYDPSYLERYKLPEDAVSVSKPPIGSPLRSVTPVVKINDRVVLNNVPYNSIMGDIRKRKVQDLERLESGRCSAKLHRMNSESEAMDLSMPSLMEKSVSPEMNPSRYNGASPTKENELRISNLHIVERTNPLADSVVRNSPRNVEYKDVEKANFSDSSSTLVADRIKLSYKIANDENYKHNGAPYESNEVAFNRDSENVINLKTQNQTEGDAININYVIQENHPSIITTFTEVPNSFSPMDYDNSAMETLADVATKQVKLEKNTLAKSVASEFLMLATKQEFQTNDGTREPNNYVSSTKEVNEMIVKSEENKICTICAKNFSKPSQLRLHMNIHYLERPFRCDPCSVSFRTKGHLQKHERSASHHNKLSSSPLLSSSEPRPFKCSDCNIAFRIHGHLAKHLRSKMHIMKLECLAKIPFGLYAELERANSLLTEINTTDGDQCLESLKALARKVFVNDPSKLNQVEVSLNSTDASDS